MSSFSLTFETDGGLLKEVPASVPGNGRTFMFCSLEIWVHSANGKWVPAMAGVLELWIGPNTRAVGSLLIGSAVWNGARIENNTVC